MAGKSIFAAGESSMPAVTGHGAGPTLRRGFSSQLRASSAVNSEYHRSRTVFSRGKMAETNGTGGPKVSAETTPVAAQRPPLLPDADVEASVVRGGPAGLTAAPETVPRAPSREVL